MQLQIHHAQTAEGIHEVVICRQAGAALGAYCLQHNDLHRILILADTAGAAGTTGTASAACAACAADTAIAADAAVAALAAVAACAAIAACAAGAAVTACAALDGQINGIRRLGMVDGLIYSRVVGICGTDQLSQINGQLSRGHELVGNIKGDAAALNGGGLGGFQAHVVGVEPCIAHHVHQDEQIPVGAEHMVRVGDGGSRDGIAPVGQLEDRPCSQLAEAVLIGNAADGAIGINAVAAAEHPHAAAVIGQRVGAQRDIRIALLQEVDAILPAHQRAFGKLDGRAGTVVDHCACRQLHGGFLGGGRPHRRNAHHDKCRRDDRRQYGENDPCGFFKFSYSFHSTLSVAYTPL